MAKRRRSKRFRITCPDCNKKFFKNAVTSVTPKCPRCGYYVREDAAIEQAPRCVDCGRFHWGRREYCATCQRERDIEQAHADRENARREARWAALYNA
jgi:uncharacterized OB-fold protein